MKREREDEGKRTSDRRNGAKMILVLHREHTYRPPRPVTEIELLFSM
jgi:hypothetical protein